MPSLSSSPVYLPNKTDPKIPSENAPIPIPQSVKPIQTSLRKHLGTSALTIIFALIAVLAGVLIITRTSSRFTKLKSSPTPNKSVRIRTTQAVRDARYVRTNRTALSHARCLVAVQDVERAVRCVVYRPLLASTLEPYIEVTPMNVSFGRQPIGSKSVPDKISLTNKGPVAITISIAIAGINATDFAETGTCGSRLAAGRSCFIEITFMPSIMGTKTANLSISGSFTVTYTPSGEKTSIEPIEGKVVTLSGTGA